jgi:hypothetical protein
MINYGEYTTIWETRKLYLGSNSTIDDDLLLRVIRDVSREIDRMTKHVFYPVIETRRFDTPQKDYYLDLQSDLLQLNTLRNGDGTLLDITQVFLYPLNQPTRRRIWLPPNVSIWKNANNGYPNSAIEVNGIWVYIYDAASCGWEDLDLLAADLDATGSFDTLNNVFYAGQLLKMDDEWAYVKNVVTTVSTDPVPVTTYTVNLVRGVNGTNASTHVLGTQISWWTVGYELRLLAAAAVTAYYNLRSNPTASKLTLDGVTFETPKDVSVFIHERLKNINLIKIAVG